MRVGVIREVGDVCMYVCTQQTVCNKIDSNLITKNLEFYNDNRPENCTDDIAVAQPFLSFSVIKRRHNIVSNRITTVIKSVII